MRSVQTREVSCHPELWYSTASMPERGGPDLAGSCAPPSMVDLSGDVGGRGTTTTGECQLLRAVGSVRVCYVYYIIHIIFRVCVSAPS
jgi:hypothetical protein|eukprot:6768778-Prymnesium_polylepis.1